MRINVSLSTHLLSVALMMCVNLYARSNQVRVARSAGVSDCSNEEHVHRCVDFRIKAVRVERVNDCGFEYADLEENTVGLPEGDDHRWDYSAKFELARFNGNRVEWMGRRDVRAGMYGMSVYCSYPGCKRVLLLQLVKPGSLPAKPE